MYSSFAYIHVVRISDCASQVCCLSLWGYQHKRCFRVVVSSGLRPIPPPCLDSWTLDVVGGYGAVVELWGTESARISNSGPLEACRQYASSGTEEVRLEACPLYASSNTDQVPLEACWQYASSGTECMCVGISCYAFRGSLGGSFEASWGPFEGPLGVSFGPLVDFLRPPWGLLGASWGPLVASWPF